jgi:cytochrome c peroxidase
MLKFYCTLIILLLIVGLPQCKQHNTTAVKEAPLVTAGRYLFYDRRLSVNNTKACGSCHAPQFSFTDSYSRSIGALGDLHQRNARPLINLAYNKYYTAADSTITTLEAQMNGPMFNTHPAEMGMQGNETKILAAIAADSMYQHLFAAAFPNQKNTFSITNIQTAIAAFEKTITAFNTPYDTYTAGNSTALTALQQQGMQLFFSDVLQCNKCHGSKNFNTPVETLANGSINYYYNTGLYGNNYPVTDRGLFESTGNKNDIGKFRVPTLRNLMYTAPYFHDGSAATITDVINAYAAGGRQNSTYKSQLIKGFTLTLQQQKALISFLYSLTDSTVITNPAYANPFKEDETKK